MSAAYVDFQCFIYEKDDHTPMVRVGVEQDDISISEPIFEDESEAKVIGWRERFLLTQAEAKALIRALEVTLTSFETYTSS